MPATKLSDQATTVRRFDVLAIAPVEADQPLHVMLCSEKDDREDVTVESELRVAHMGPLARVAKQQWNSAKQYRIHPPVTKPSRDCNFWRFSCVGFVLAAYQDAGITLIGNVKPGKRLDQLKRIYADARLDDPAFRADMGIGTGDDWPVVLAGYVINALNRPAGQIHGEESFPYEPSEDDEYFPRRPSENLVAGR